MNAVEALNAARNAQLSITVEGNNVVLAGSVKPPADLRTQKADLRVGDQSPAPKETADVGRFGGITADTAEKTAAILAGFSTKARLVHTISEATDAIHQLLVASGTDGVIGADIETTPLGPFATNNEAGLDPYRSEVRVLSLWNPRAGDALVIDLRHASISELPKELWNAHLVFHNATFDTKHLLRAGAPLRADKLLCSMLVSGFVIRGETGTNRVGNRRPSLAAAASELLGIDVPKEGQTANWGWPNLDRPLVDYAALDAVLAYQVLKVAVAKMGNSGHRAVDIACACILGVARLELAGLPFDAEIHRAVAGGWEEKLGLAQTRAKELTGINNLNSSPQIAAWLAQVLPIKVREKWPRTDGGKLSTEGKVLRRCSEHHPGLNAIADYSKVKTLVASFGLPLLKHVNPVTTRLHTSLQIAQAKSGRFSSKNPNLQNIPRDALVRSAVRAPAGSKLIVADYSQIELRVLAEVAGDERMRNAYVRGLDLHAVTAAHMLGIVPDQFDNKNPEHAAARQKAKGVNFGIIYGCGAPGLVAFARDNYSIVMSECEARTVIATWMRTYRGVSCWQKRHVRRCESSRVVQTPAGRIYRFAWEPNGRFNYNLALNLPIQGGAAEVAQIAIAKIDASLTQHLGERARLVGQVHDEFILIAEESVAERARTLLLEAMTEAFTALFPGAPVRNLVDAKIATSWSEAKG